jgi:transposase
MGKAEMKHIQRRKHTAKSERRVSISLFERIQPDAAGIDCGQNSHFVSVPPERDPEPLREFRTFTTDLHRLAQWLAQCGVKTVAMESTGVYWIPLYEILEQRGFEVVLVNAHDLHNVRGRKSDVQDCEWLRRLHSVGLLRPSFRPAAAMVPLRSFMRQPAILVEELTARILRMQKALTEMNLMLHTVVSDITGVTGLKIIRAILAGERDPERLAVHRDGRCHASREELSAALTGNYRAEHLFSLQQNFAAYQFHLQQIVECDAAIEALLNTLAAQQPPPTAALPAPRPKAVTRKHAPVFDIRSPLHRLTGGADLSQINCIGPQAALQIVAEIGTDMSRWPTAKTSPLGLRWRPTTESPGDVSSAPELRPPPIALRQSCDAVR